MVLLSTEMYSSFRMRRKQKESSFEIALNQINIESAYKTILKERYIRVLREFQRRCLFLSFIFHTSRFIITVGSLIVPALLSIQYTDTNNTTTLSDSASLPYRIYWTTWVISLLVTTCNGIVSIFKIEKKYYYLHTTLELLRSEGWQFLQLSGRYSGFYTPKSQATHANQFIFFSHSIERIKMKQVEEEYYKLTDSQHSESSSTKSDSTSTSQSVKKDSLIPPTPLNSLLEQYNALPSELLQQMSTMANLAKKEREDGRSKTEENKKNPGSPTQATARAPTLSMPSDMSTETP